MNLVSQYRTFLYSGDIVLSSPNLLGIFFRYERAVKDLSKRGVDLKKMVSEATLRNFIIAELDGDRDLFDRLFGHFSRHLEEFNSAKCEPAALVPLAHKIRSGCHSFGAGYLYQKLSEIENMGNAINMADLVVLYGDAKLLTGPTLECLTNLADDIFKEIKKSA